MNNYNPMIEEQANSANAIINILTVIDTDKVRQKNPNPSKDPNSATGLDHTYQYMVVSNNEAISGQGTGDLFFHTVPGDVVRMSMVSEYNNMDNPVFIYKIEKFDDGKQSVIVFDEFRNYAINTKTVIPGSPDPLKIITTTETFNYYQANVMQTGREAFKIYFAMYERQRNGDPILVGYFFWDPAINVTE